MYITRACTHGDARDGWRPVLSRHPRVTIYYPVRCRDGSGCRRLRGGRVARGVPMGALYDRRTGEGRIVEHASYRARRSGGGDCIDSAERRERCRDREHEPESEGQHDGRWSDRERRPHVPSYERSASLYNGSVLARIAKPTVVISALRRPSYVPRSTHSEGSLKHVEALFKGCTRPKG
jgi:hypothetical protein